MVLCERVGHNGYIGIVALCWMISERRKVLGQGLSVLNTYLGT